MQHRQIKFAATSRPGDPRELTDWVRRAESLGFDRIGIADSPALYRDVWVSSVQIAQATTSIPFGPWVTNPISRHPVVTASAALSVNELAPGRVYVGIGTGNSGVYNLGKKASRIVCRAPLVDRPVWPCLDNARCHLLCRERAAVCLSDSSQT